MVSGGGGRTRRLGGQYRSRALARVRALDALAVILVEVKVIRRGFKHAQSLEREAAQRFRRVRSAE